METPTTENLLLQIEKLQNRLAEADQLIELIKAGEVDAFALNKNNKPEVFTLQSGDYAYRVLVENFSEGALNLSEDGLILYANTAFYDILQLSYEKVIGHHISQFIHPDSKESFNELLIKGLTGQSKGEINLLVGKNSCPVYVSLASLYPNLPTVGVIVSNLTERKQAIKELEAKKSLQNIFLSAPAAIAVLEGHEHKYILANQFYEKITNHKATDLLGKSNREVFPELIGTGTFELFDKVFETGEPFTTPEYPIMLDFKNEGVLRQCYFNFSIDPLKNDSGKIYGVIVMLYETTEQVEARKKIEESEQRFRSLVEQAPVAMCVFRGENFVFEVVNEKQLQLIGKTKQQVINLPVVTAMPEAVGQGYEELLNGVYTKGIPFTANESPLTVIRNGKEEINYVNYVFEPLYNAEHKIDGVFSVATDVTEQVLARKKEEETEFRYQEMIYSSPSMISILKGEEMIIEIANDAVLASWGKRKDIIGKSIFLVLPEVVEQGFDKLLLNVYKTGEPYNAYETPITLLRNGIKEIIYYNFIYQAQCNINGEIEGVAILANEVTPQASLNKKIKESEQRYHTLFMQSPFAFSIMKGKDMKVTLANDLMLEFWGKGKNVEGKALLEILPELSNQPFPAMIDSVYTTGVPVYANEILAQLNLNGIMEDKYFNIVYEPHFEADHKISGVITIAHEVTQQVLTRKNIQESETLFKLALFLTAKTVFKQDAQLKYTWIYNTHPSLKMKDIVGKLDSDLFSNDSAEILTTIKQAVLDTGTTFNSDIQIEIDGKTFDFTLLVEATKDVAGKINGIIAVSDDITEKKQAENKIRESEQEIRKIKEQLELSIRAGKIGVWHFDVKNDLLYWSNEQKAIYGLEPSAELLNLAQYKALVIPEDWERLNKDLQSAPLAEEQEYDFRIIRKNDGEIRWIKSMERNILDPQGAPQFISGVNIDITEQVLAFNKIQASEEKFKRLVLQAPVAICVLRGKDYVIETMNEGMCTFCDRTLAQALNKPIFDVLPELMDQGIKELLDNVYFTGERCVVQELSINIMHNDKLENAFVKFVYEPLREADGTVSGVMALVHEITEQVVARKKVEESEKKFEAAILAVEGIIWTNNAKGEMMGEQPGWANLTGQQLEEYQGYGWSNAIHPDDAQPTVDAWNQAVATNSTFEFEHKVKTAQNEWRLFSVKAVPAFDKNGAVQQWVGVHTDITEQKLAVEKLAYRTALLEAHNEANIDGLLLVDAKGKILSFNQRFVAIWNIPQHILNDKNDEAIISFAMNQLVNPQQFIDNVKYFYEHPTETSLDELEFTNGKMVERNGYSVIGEDGTYYAWSWTFKDITERKRIEQDLKNTKNQLELTFKNIPAGVYLLNEKGEIVYVNDRGAAVYGDFTPEYILKQKDLLTLLKIADELFERFDENGKYLSAQDSPAFISLTTGKASQGILKQINKVTREQRWYYVQGAPLFDEKGNVSLVLITSTDITEQKNAEEKIKYSEERFRSLAETLPQMVWVMNGDGEMEYASKSWEKYSGIADVADGWNYMTHPDDRQRLTVYWNQAFAGKKGYQHEVRLKNKEGIYRWFYSVGEPVLNADKKVSKWVGSLTDIHEQKLKEERKDEFISIASHELKTPLTTAKAYLQMLELYLDESNEEAGLYVKKANQAVNRLNELISELLDVSKISLGKINYTVSTFNFNDMIDSTVENIQLISPKHTIEKNGKVHDNVTGDKDRLQQVVINLLTNAIKYSPGSDKVFITVGQQNDMINVSVRDTGIGIAKQSLYKIFEKYHRIEEHAVHFQGLGIGLYISYEIIQRHHGKLWAESEPGIGSIFYFSLQVKHIES